MKPNFRRCADASGVDKKTISRYYNAGVDVTDVHAVLAYLAASGKRISEAQLGRNRLIACHGGKTKKQTGFSMRFWSLWCGVNKEIVRRVLIRGTAKRKLINDWRGNRVKKREEWRINVAKERGVKVDATFDYDSREEYLFDRLYMEHLKDEMNAWKRFETIRGHKEWTVSGRKRKEWSRKWMDKFRKSGTPSAIKHRMRNRVRSRLKKKIAKELLNRTGYGDIDIIIRHLERNFQKGMTWKNTDKWHIDHIVPLAKFDLTKPEEVARASHWTNLQPLWKEENLKKGARGGGQVELIY